MSRINEKSDYVIELILHLRRVTSLSGIIILNQIHDKQPSYIFFLYIDSTGWTAIKLLQSEPCISRPSGI